MYEFFNKVYQWNNTFVQTACMKNIVLQIFLWLLPIIVVAQPQENNATKQLTILYTNDLHAHVNAQKLDWISQTHKIGGFANIATLVKKEKAANPHTVYFDAGDYFTGPYISSLTKGEAVIDVMNHLSIDAACIGNHEFDHGWQNVPLQLKKATFPILNGNIFVKKSQKLLWNFPYKIIVKNGIRIGVIGLHGQFAFYDTISDEMIQGVEARNEEKYLQQYINELKGKTDIIVLLIHEGIPGRQSSIGTADVGRNLKKDLELAQNVSGVDVIVTGHAHQGTPEALISNGTIIVSTDALGMQLGKLNITYDANQDKIIAYENKLDYIYDDEVEDDSATLATIQKWEKKLAAVTDEKICTSPVKLFRSYGEESLLGNMVADAMLSAHPTYDFALVNSGGLRQDVEAGSITLGNLISAFPFPNTNILLEMKGKEVLDLFEHAASLTNGILQVSKGVEFVYSESLPVGKRVVSLKIKGAPLQLNQTYKIITSNFMADGGDGYFAFKKATQRKNTQEFILDAMAKYLKTFKVYSPSLEGRVKAGS